MNNETNKPNVANATAKTVESAGQSGQSATPEVIGQRKSPEDFYRELAKEWEGIATSCTRQYDQIRADRDEIQQRLARIVATASMAIDHARAERDAAEAKLAEARKVIAENERAVARLVAAGNRAA